jgi:Leucine-rich repeat (LRR) protein
MVYSLNVQASSIIDLTGIEVFTNLHTLDCSRNQLTSLNVSGLSELVNLICNDNKLISLDVSG